jgi:peptide/nickel transport system permease protein
MSAAVLLGYIARRVLVLIALLILVSFAVFSLLYMSSGNPVELLLGPRQASPATIRQLTIEYHLDKPFLDQYWIWASDAVRLQFGNSIQTSLPVTEEISTHLPTTVFLGIYAFILTMVFGVGLGILSALRRRSFLDRGIVGSVVVGLSTPAFVAGVALIYVFSILVRWFPAAGQGSGFGNEVWHLTLPAVALALTTAAYVLKHTRAAVIGTLDQDYVVFARARGLSARRVIFSYAVRNALIPILTISGVMLSTLIVGAVFVEMTFSIQGIGQLLVQSATTKDIPVLQGVALLAAALVMVVNLLTDVIYMVSDPRIRLGRGSS